LEERARYIYALSQELTNTLSQMDGVLAARVHVVLPERGGVGENTTPSTAAVFIKHQAGYNLDALQPQIRKLVTHAIPGLTE
ncbi:EscJ/YscJ/HrcJ family type III secretion inner membrane ring protein, partial [Campylobacter jejuni]|nr:EscJ/YscJ/HrcJ family type III secretion inner membrane ring protein [Campylobacter jejuni]